MSIKQFINSEDRSKLNVATSLWINGVKKIFTTEFCGTAIVASGVATFYLTEGGGATDPALFTRVYKESARFWTDNEAQQYQYGGYTLSANKKVLTINVNRLGTVLVGVIQFISSANGTVCYCSVKGD